MMQRFLYEFESYHDKKHTHSESFINLPSVACYCMEFIVSDPADAARQNYFAHEKCMEEGYRLLGSEPLFIVLNDQDPFTSPLKKIEYHYTFCIPVIPDSDSDPNIRFFPETEAFSIIGFGDYSIVPGLWETLLKEIEKRDLSPSGPIRAIAHVAAYAGIHYEPSEFCFELAVPIKPS